MARDVLMGSVALIGGKEVTIIYKGLAEASTFR